MVDTYNLYQLQGRIHRLMNVLFILHTQNFSIAEQENYKNKHARKSSSASDTVTVPESSKTSSQAISTEFETPEAGWVPPAIAVS